MKHPLLNAAAIVFLMLASCKDDTPVNPTTKNDFKSFIKNTEWVGTLDGNGYEYRLPVSLKFNDDNTFTLYSLFVFFTDGVEETRDSITGPIISIDSLPDGRMHIATNINTSFRPITTTSLYITDRKEVMGLSSDPNELPTFQAELFPAEGISANGEWTGPARTSPGANNAYPDLSTITFLANESVPVTYYRRQGQPVQFANTQLRVVYQQKGARVYMDGYDESRNGGSRVPYFGVLLPSGNKMMVHSRDVYARLPHYVYTNEPYGPNGVTPTIVRN
ncbi:hypothetical protein [Chryseolinea lacunae]|uniref:Uncharacterized protein n=1 Tax=Chryseolinea lacunae TaxID=2801331 RepID=A0ABS1KW90_9BACT|nr:hypothetical protein [Chryseolinea lacunae]MBL0743700.1 hypothetical protein [Chryseolinea lacunae]